MASWLLLLPLLHFTIFTATLIFNLILSMFQQSMRLKHLTVIPQGFLFPQSTTRTPHLKVNESYLGQFLMCRHHFSYPVL